MPGELESSESEITIKESFDKVVAEHFADSNTIDEFIAAFNEQFPPNNYLEDFNRKLDAEYIFDHHLISCTGTALLLEAFFKQRFGDELSVFFSMDNLTSKGHTVVLVVPTSLVPHDFEPKVWLEDKLKTGDYSNIGAYTYFKKYSLTAFNITKIPTYDILFDSTNKYIASRKKAFQNALDIDV